MKNPIENKIVKWFIRGLTGIILGAYTLTIVQTKIILRKEIDLNGDDWTIIVGCLVVWLAFESAVAWLKKKASN